MKLYDGLAAWWPLMSPPAHYAEEAAALAPLLQGDTAASRARVLELGSGGGHLASHLKLPFGMTLVDRSPRMLDLSRSLPPNADTWTATCAACGWANPSTPC